MFFPRCGIHHYSLNFVQSHYYWDNIWQHRIIPCWYVGTSQTLALQSHAFPSLFSSEVTWNQCQSHRPGPEQTENITFRVHVHSISMFQCCVHSVIYGTHHISQCCQKTYLWSWSLIYTVAGDPLGSLHICDHEDISLIYIYIWWSIGKHQWSWSHIWYPNVYIWRFPQIGLPCTTQHPRHGWSEGPGHLTTRTESPAPAARSPRSQPLGPCWLFFLPFFKPTAMADGWWWMFNNGCWWYLIF